MNQLDKALWFLIGVIMLLLFYFVWSVSHGGLQCVQDPIQYAQDSLNYNATCFCTATIKDIFSIVK